jgi:lipopolysaccharide biosynthesis protein
VRRITAAGVVRRARRYARRFAYATGLRTNAIEHETYPAGFRRWLDRRSFKLKGDFPDAWRGADPLTGPFPRLAVVVHVYYPELLPELLSHLAVIPVPFDLLLTNASGSPLDDAALHVGNLRQARQFIVPNHGRDILPLISLVNAGLLDPYELVLKVHTKKSEWRADHGALDGTGDSWRTALLGDLLDSTGNVSRILGNFAEDPGLGLITAQGSVLGKEFWGGNEAITRDLLRRIQLPLETDVLRFAAGSMYWIRGFILQGLRAFDLSADDFEPEAGQIDGTTAHAIERIVGIVAREAGYELADTVETPDPDSWMRFDPETPVQPDARVIPFYLPQFHTFAENDRWWGNGFTEWSNVAAARSVFDGHTQPLLPGELGFYDLSVEGTRRRQEDLALSAGLEGFMYYYYWFAGKRLMDLPIEAHHADDSSLGFCIMWANENWTRRWDGSDENILIAQDYERVPATQFIHDVMHLLVDPRYVRIDGKPVVAVYRIAQIPDFESMLTAWRVAAVAAGLPGLTILTVDVGGVMHGIEGDAIANGLDGEMAFPPHNHQWVAQPSEPLGVDGRFEGRLMNYNAMARAAETAILDEVPDERYPGVMVSFDNTARRQWKPDVWYGSNPYSYRRWLRSTVVGLAHRPLDQRVIFVNAWNEWAESAVLEPTQRFGRTYLLATRDALLR